MTPTPSAPPPARRVLAGLGGVAGPVPRGRQRRGGPGPRRLPRPAAGRAGAERRRRRRAGRCARTAAARRWRDDVLRAANTGAPLDAAGVEGLATLRASASGTRTARSGRFGVGFAAVLAVSDEPAVTRTAGGVRFSAARDPGRGRRAPALAEELAPARGSGAGAAAAVAGRGRRRPRGSTPRSCSRCGPAPARRSRGPRRARPELLLALPGLARRSRSAVAALAAAAHRRRPRSGRPTATAPTGRSPQRSGELPPRCSPTARSRNGPPRAGRSPGRCPLDDDGAPRRSRPARSSTRRRRATSRCRCPLRLIAPFPLGPDRRHVAPGPVTDALVDAAADTFADLVTGAAGRPGAARLVPRAGLPGAALDAALGAACSSGSGRRPGCRWPARPRRGSRPTGPPRSTRRPTTGWRSWPTCCPGCCRPTGPGASDTPALAALGVRRVGIAEAVEAVRGVERPASWWARLYAALDGADREELAALPVPLSRRPHRPRPGRGAAARSGAARRAPGPAGPAAGRAGRGRPAGGAPAARAAGRAAGDGGRRARRPRRPQRRRDVDGRGGRRLDDGPEPEDAGPRGARARRGRPAGARRAAVAGRAGAAGRRRGMGAGRRAGAAGLGAGRRAGGRRARDAGPGAAATAIPRRCGRSACSTPSRWSAGTDPDDLDVDAADRWADAVLDRLPPDAPPPSGRR